MDWVPRSVRARAREIERAIAELEAKLGRAPTDEEIAKKVGITVDELEDSLTEIARSSIAALDELWTVSGTAATRSRSSTRSRTTDAPDPQGTLSHDRDEGGDRRRDRAPARAREARRDALLLRGADPPRDRRGARRHRVPRLAAPHEGDPPPQGAARSAAPACARARTRARRGLRFASESTEEDEQSRWLPPSPGKIRNIAVAGHRGVGKTSLVEALLFQAGKTNRLGTIEQGTTVSDWDDARAASAQMSLSGSLLPPRVAGPQDQPRRHARATPASRPTRSRRCASSRALVVVAERRHGRRGQHVARLEARRRVRALARRLRQHARPRARRLLPRARGGARSSSPTAASRSSCRSAPSTS